MPIRNYLQTTDVSQAYKDINSQISALQAYNAVSQGQKQNQKTEGDSQAQYQGLYATQLNKISEQQKRFQRNTPTSYKQLIELIGSVKGNGSETSKEIRNIFLEAALKLEPTVGQIVSEESFKILGCSQQQTYKGFNANFVLNSVPTFNLLQPDTEGIYVRMQDIDLAGALKIKPTSKIGKIYYETTGITSLSQYVNYSKQPNGKKFPMNYELNERIQQQGTTFRDNFGVFYDGVSHQNIFDITYSKTNGVGVQGDYFRVFLLDREGSPISPPPGSPLIYSANTIATGLVDYYKSIKMFDAKILLANLLNLALGTLNNSLSINQIEGQTKLNIIINRILGRCSGGENEIDIAGTAKLSELDVIDDEFFEFTEQDERFINQTANNIKNNVVEYEDCGNVKLPVDNDSLQDQLIDLGNRLENLTIEEQVSEMERILDSIPEKWEQDDLRPSINVQNPFNQSLLDNFINAIVASVLTPKQLLPIFVFLQEIQNQVLGFSNNIIVQGNQVVQQVNPQINQANNLNSQINQQITSGVDFAKKFRTFLVNVVGRILELFLEILFDLLKKELLTLIKTILRDIYKRTRNNYVLMVQRLLEVGEFVVDTFVSYRECKSLVKQIQKVLSLILRKVPLTPSISRELLFLSDALPGISSERAVLLSIQKMQKAGLPTGPLPDGSPNRIIEFMIALTGGSYEEFLANNKIQAFGITPPVAGGYVEVFGKTT
jgi:hypothetical protein